MYCTKENANLRMQDLPKKSYAKWLSDDPKNVSSTLTCSSQNAPLKLKAESLFLNLTVKHVPGMINKSPYVP